MKRMSRRMKRLIAILVVEVLVAINVLTAYADEANQPLTIAEADLANDEVVTEPVQEPVVEATEAPTQEPVVEATEAPTQEPVVEAAEEPAQEPMVEPAAEPTAEAVAEPTATEDIAAETPTPEVSDESETPGDVPAETPDALSSASPSASPSVSPSASPSATPTTEVVEEENAYVITGICEADGSEIGESFTISVSDATDVNAQAPVIEGYTYTGVASLEDGTQVTDLKKETVETETEEKTLVETIISYQAGGAWVTVTEDMTITFEYEAEETDTETVAESVSFYVVCVDQDGNVIAGYEEKELSVNETLDLTAAPIVIAGYEYQGALINDQKVLSLDKNVEIDENNKEVVTYSYTPAATTYSLNAGTGITEVTEDTTITLVYEVKEAAEEITFTIQCVDASGKVIEGYEDVQIPVFEDKLVLNDSKNAPVTIEGYDYWKAMYGEGWNASQLTSINKESTVDEVTGETVTTYSVYASDYWGWSEREITLDENAVVKLYYTVEAPEVTAKLVDESGAVVNDRTELPTFNNWGTVSFVANNGQAIDNIPLDGYRFLRAEVNGTAIKNLYKYTDGWTNNQTTYSYETTDGNRVTIEDDTEVTFVYIKKALAPGASVDFKSALGSAVNYGIVAREIATGNHMDTNFATALLNNAGQTTAGKYTGNHNPGDFIIAEYQGSGWFTDCSDATRPFVIYTTPEAEAKFGASIYDNQMLYIDTTNSKEQLASRVDALFAGVDSSLASQSGYTPEYVLQYTSDQKYELDLTSSSAGTYYLNFAEGEYEKYAGSDSRMRIKMNSNQNVVFNIPDSTVGLHKFDISVDGSAWVGSDISNEGADFYTQKFIFNMPNATSVATDGGIVGAVLCPNADFHIGATSTGWLVAKKVTNGGEWHGVWQDMPDSVYVPGSTELKASKSVNGQTPTAEQVFNFKLEEYKDGEWQLVETKSNEGSEITFSAISYEAEGTYYYRVSEETGTGDYQYDETKYIAKVVVTSTASTRMNTTTTTYKVASITYYEADSIDGAVSDNVVSDVAFENTKIEKGSVAVTKKVAGTDNATLTGKTFYFVLKDGEGNAIGGVREIKNGTTVTISDLALGSYTIVETDVNGNAVAYDAASFPYEVTYVSSNITLNAENKDVSATITNTYNPEKISVDGSKTWDDNNNQDGVRPESITIRLWADGVEKASQTVKPDDSGNWSWSFAGLDKYTAEGVEIAYTITEDAVAGYETTVDGYNVTNSHTPEDTGISGLKVWSDNDDQDGLRPDSITVNLLANGTKVDSQVVTAGTDGKWSWSFTGLDKYKDGAEITYTVTEEAVEGYSVAITGNATEGYTITNTHEPGKTGISVTKVWNDSNDQDGLRPDSITVKLLANGSLADVDNATVTLSEDNDWKYNWIGLAEKKAGTVIEYTVEEAGVPADYTSEITGTAAGGYTITNTYTPETTSVSGAKTWADNNNQDGVRPESIIINLLADGEKIDSKTVTSADGWAYSFDNLPKYKEQGTEIVYTVTEDEVAGYTATVTGYNVLNTHTPETTEVGGSKVWDDNDNQDGVRPESIVVNLLADGTQIDSQVVTAGADGSWSWSFTDLPKYKNVDGKGVEIVYTVTENAVADYSTEITGSAAEDFTITNTHTPDETAISVVKVWNDNNNQDGKRPASIRVQLKANGTDKGDVVTLNEANSWSYTWSNLPVNSAKGQAISYTVEEVSIPTGYAVSYKTVGTTTTITNTHETEKTSVSGTKAWEDADNQDGLRPDSITVALYADGVSTGKTATATAEGGWSWSFTELDKYANGSEIVYTVKEDAVANYTTVITGSAAEGFVITNNHTPEKTQISGSKVWVDKDDQDGVRPSEITVTLYADGVSTGKTATATAEEWTFAFTDLDKYADGKVIEYTVVEEKIEGYTSVVTGSMTSGYTITNTHEPGKTNYTVQKFWDDNNNQDGMRPVSIQVQLLADGEAYGSAVTLNAGNGWKYTWSDLDEKKAGTDIEYAVEEITIDEAYEVSYISVENGMNITNTHTPEKTEISGSKTWVDNNDQDGLRPESITITLYADGNVKAAKTVTAADNWSWTFTDLDVYANGTKITYTIAENAVDGYETEINGFDVTNTHTPEKTEIKGIKVWNDANDQDGKRPSEITVNLLANGNKIDSKTVTADAEGNWSYAFTNLDKYADGEVIEYTVEEEMVTLTELGYSASYDGTTITNSYTPGKTNHKVVKVWDDANDQDGLRPVSIEVQLLADGVAVEGSKVILSASNSWSHEWTELDLMKAGTRIVYTAEEVGEVTGYTVGEPATSNNITTITNTHTPEEVNLEGTKTWNDAEDQDGKRPSEITIVLVKNGAETDITAKATAANGWTYSFNNLPKFENGEEITYTIKEITVEGYTAVINGFDITNTHEPEKTELSGSKVWDDADNQDGKRPASITVNLLANNKETGKSVVVTPDASGNWSWSFKDLPKYESGREIVYTVTENTVDEYTTEIVYGMDGVTITNSYTPGVTDHSVVKVWNDANDQDGKRPASIEVQLYADGVALGNTVTLNATNNWTYKWENLDLMSAGKAIAYTVKEVGEIAEYTTEEVTDTETRITTITNSYTTKKTEVEGAKTWNDADNQDGKRPASITINLLADGKEVAEKVVTASDNWSWKFENLDVYKGGKLIEYTITEDAVENYESAVEGYNVTNTHKPETTQVEGSKTWNDADNQDGVRPESIQINLLANGKTVKSVTVTEADDWKWNFTDLAKYADGKEITYTITETVTNGYTAEINGFDVTNSYTPGKTSLSVSKVWDDAEDQDGIRPATVKVQLYADGVAVEGKTAELNAANGWSYTWTELDAKKAGKTIVYTAKETEVPDGYKVAYNDENTGTTVVTNTHAPELTKVSGAKTWDDADDQDGKRPESITINLLADGTKVASKTVSAAADGTWTYEFDNLPKFKAGKEIVYTITEEEVTGYTTVVDGYDVNNTHTPEKTQVEGTKTWVDNNDAEKARPASITIRLWANGEEIDNRTVTAETGWSWSFTDLDKYADGKEIAYTITEDVVFDYSTEINGYDVTNTYTPGVTSISVTKVWEDNDNQDGKRAKSVTVQLYEKFGIFNLKRGEAIELSADNNWTYTWTDLPVEKQKEKVQYSVKEINKITGYETEINNGDDKSTNITITNVNEPETTEVEGVKTWVDADNQDGVRPESITIRLIADAGTDYEKEVAVKTVTADEDWSYSFEDLPKYRNGGVEIVYTITEDAVTDYEAAVDGYNVTNTHTPADTEYAVKKVWNDKNDQDGIRPQSIQVQLIADGKPVTGKNAELNAANGWSATWTGLDMYADGELIVYTAKEIEVPEGYTLESAVNTDGLTTITNAHTPETTSVSGLKTWTDENDQDGVRPASITIRLYADGEEVDSKTVTAADGWQWSFTDLDKYAAGKLIEYTITEDAVAKYDSEVTGFDVENTYTPETVKVEGTKTWDDADNQDGKRPESITITLSADGTPIETVTVTEEDGWAWSFTDLPKYKDQGTEIKYTISETAVEEYTTTYDGYNVTNSYTPGKTGVTVTKAWKDAEDQDGLRPDSIQVQLLADKAAQGDPVTLNEENSWTYTWTELDLMKAGKEILYTVDEVGAAEGYTKVVSGDAAGGFTITNTHIPATTEIEGAKTWVDENNQDGLRPDSITINLLADGKQIDSVKVTAENDWTWEFTELPKYRDGGVEIEYTFTEEAVEDYTTEVKGTDVINTHIPAVTEVEGSKTWDDDDNAEGVRPESITIRLYADGEEIDSVTVTEAEEWKWSFTELPKYRDGGVEILYTITEDAVVDYSTTIEGYDVTNEYTPGWTQISVTKVWDDAEDQDGLRPESIKVQLYEEVLGGFLDIRVRGEEVELNAENGWTYTWEKLPAKRLGRDVTYTVKEVGEVEGYTTTQTVNGASAIITNKHVPEVVDMEGIKVWDDAENQDGVRPESITIKLLADGVDTGKFATVTADDNWAWSFTELPKNKNVNGEVSEILYTIEEFAVEGYETEITGDVTDGFTVTNTHKPEVIEIEGTKTWDDADDQDGIRPESITVRLFADGEEVDSKTVTEAEDWSYKFTELPKFKAGTEIVYTITEDVVEGYSTTYDGYNVTNSYTPGETARTVVKIWNDQNNRDNLRPGSIVVQLMADGKEYGAAVTLSAANGWTYTWTDLPEKSAGETIVYTVAEISTIGGYTVSYSGDGFTITNTHTPEEPTPTPTPTSPADQPTPTPYTPTPTPDQPVPTPTPTEPEREVLGAQRVEGEVLGVRRGTDRAVLGKRRRPATGDSMAIILWVMALAGSVGSAITSVVMMGYNKKQK